MIRAAALQHDGPERLYARCRECGTVVTGFPCGGFGAREPGGEKQIGASCRHLIAVTRNTPRWSLHRDLHDREGCGVASLPAHARPHAPRPVTAVEALR